MLQCFVGHDRTQVGAADADVDDVANAFAGVPLPRAAPHAIGEIGHLVQHGVDLRHDVLAIHDDGCSSGRAKGYMQDRAVFRNVDFVAAEHGLDAPAESAVLRQPEEQFQGLPGYAIFRVIQVQADRFDRHALAAGGILRKKLAQMQLTDLLIVTCKALPCLALIERRDLLGHLVSFALRRETVVRPSTWATSPGSAGLLEGGALGSDHAHELVPRIDERLGPFVLEPCGQVIDIDAGRTEPASIRFRNRRRRPT